MKKILSSAVLLGVVVAGVSAGTLAYFDDTEVSANNTFVAGQIDLEVGHQAWVDQGAGYVADTAGTWGVQDLTASQIFFNFDDVKPGDSGYGYATLQVSDNPSWVCSNIELTASDDDAVNDAESADEDTTAGDWNGELDDQLNFFFWNDDGDGVYEAGESVVMPPTTLNNLPQGAGNGGQTFDLVDSTTHVFGGTVGTPFTPAPGAEYLGQAWCFGTMTVDAVNGGFTCSGVATNNVAQGDDVVGDITFYAVQSRHNENFECSTWTP
ncbi:MAG: TasA family protein [Patescibacteria group bacterium]